MSSSSAPRRTNIYVDGWNLYYGLLKDKPYRWLNLVTMAEHALPRGYVIDRTRYFTAIVKSRPNNPDQHIRQRVYLRAVATLPHCTIHLGTFLESHKTRMLVTSLPDGTDRLPIVHVEEKGSDVNIATYMLFDAFKGDCDVIALVSDDSDLVEPVKILRHELGVDVIVLSPRGKSWELQQAATEFRHINRSALSRSQFPPTLRDNDGVFSRPRGW